MKSQWDINGYVLYKSDMMDMMGRKGAYFRINKKLIYSNEMSFTSPLIHVLIGRVQYDQICVSHPVYNT